MEYFFRFEQWWFLAVAILLVVSSILLRYWLNKPLYMRYTLTKELKEKKYASQHPYQTILYALQVCVLVLLSLAIAKPQIVDSRSNIIVDGIDIIVVLDASGSMQFQDYSDDQRSRFEVAKQEAVRFIEKRVNDAIGLVIFGKNAISRCPLTMDKAIIKEIIDALEIGDIDPDGTMLATAMVAAINRLKQSTVSSKIMIVLTDGEPSPGDIDPVAAIDIAKRFGIKIYTIGIGSDKDEVFIHPLYGMVAKPKVNVGLLQKIARDTSGKFFMARNARDMRTIYDTIDQLEKTKHEAPLYSRYYDVFVPIVLLVIALLGLRQLLSTFVWFNL